RGRVGLLLAARVRIRQRGGVGGTVSRGCREHEDAVAPDYGRGAAAAGERGFPLDVGLVTPGDGRVPFRDSTVRLRPTPLVPVIEPPGVEIRGRGHRGHQRARRVQTGALVPDGSRLLYA